MILASWLSSQKNADGWPPVATQNLPPSACRPVPDTEEPPDGGPPSIRRWNLPKPAPDSTSLSRDPQGPLQATTRSHYLAVTLSAPPQAAAQRVTLLFRPTVHLQTGPYIGPPDADLAAMAGVPTVTAVAEGGE